MATTNGRTASERRAKRGRPPKFGRPGRVVAVTLPDDVVRGLRKVDRDLAWAIVSLVKKQPGTRADEHNHHRAQEDAALLAVGGRRSLIVINSDVVRDLPGISMIPLHGSNGTDGGRAFLALAPGQGMSDLELAVIDRLSGPAVGSRERQALERLRAQLRDWRRDPSLRCEVKSIIVVDRVKNGGR